jgi:cobalt-zinc-cadmium efflux system membrane fusion protein
VPAPAAPGRARHTTAEKVKSALVVVVALLVLAAFVVYVVVGVPLPGLSASEGEKTVQAKAPPRIDVLSRKGEAPTVRVPEDVRAALGLRARDGNDRLATARVPAEAWPLVLSGSTALDPTHMMRVRARFAPAEVVEIATVYERTASGPTRTRDLRPGDRVKKGDLLAIFFSVDVGNKKNDLVDALVALKLDQEILAASQRAYDKGALPGLDLLAAKKVVEGDFNTIERAENTLRAWTVPEEDIEAVRKEAEQVIKKGGQRDRDPQHLKEQLRRWARVELRASDDGTLVERNVNRREVIVDPTLNLFQVAQVSSLQVVANVPEDRLAVLHALDTEQRRWVVHTAGAPAEGIAGPIDDISYVMDVNQHNAVAKGTIPNPGGVLRGGQYVTATVRLPPPENVVEIPTSALADDGRQAVVFVQADDREPGVYTMRRVEIVQRLDRSVFVRSRFSDGRDEQPLTPQEKEDGLLPRHVLRPGERVITAGVLEIKKELEDRQSV